MSSSVSSGGEGCLTPEQEAFKDAKFGMFIHWSLFSLPTGHDRWASPKGAMEHFTAEEFSASAWVDLAKDAGARYITFTSKHHDGFCLFSSQLTDFDSVHSPAKQDFLKLLADECHAEDMPLFVYYSLPDLHHPSFRPGELLEWERYVEFYQGQIREICMNYGKVAGFWLDPGPWHGLDYNYHLTETEKIIHELQPGSLIMGRDFYESEKSYPDLPGNMGRLNDYGEGDPRPMPAPGPGNWPFEVCDTINDSWQYNQQDRNFKSSSQLTRKLVGIVGMGGNYLLNQGPMASGKVQPEQARRLKVIGSWLRENGMSIYDTRPLAMVPPDWGFAVSKGNRVYLHVLQWSEGSIRLDGFEMNVSSAHLFCGEELDYLSQGGGTTVKIPKPARDEIDIIVVLETG